MRLGDLVRRRPGVKDFYIDDGIFGIVVSMVPFIPSSPNDPSKNLITVYADGKILREERESRWDIVNSA
tara:strand:+ start:1883 stop:2089 length:207 start_codon:yes stop_codon:yes gene_type:complete